jgi:hypothetical protein
VFVLVAVGFVAVAVLVGDSVEGGAGVLVDVSVLKGTGVAVAPGWTIT